MTPASVAAEEDASITSELAELEVSVVMSVVDAPHAESIRRPAIELETRRSFIKNKGVEIKSENSLQYFLERENARYKMLFIHCLQCVARMPYSCHIQRYDEQKTLTNKSMLIGLPLYESLLQPH